MKEYFSHDYNARNDTKLVKLFMKEGLKGVGAYWCIIEMLYEEGGYLLRSEYERISFELRTDLDFIISIIDDYDLFKKDKHKFWSETALERLEKRAEKSEKAKLSVQARWDKYKRNTNVKQTENKSNTIKVKESKENKIKINIDFDIFWNLYNKKIGSKDKCIKKWNKLTNEQRQMIIGTLPSWLKQFSDKQYQPYPETYLNNERWNDEINNNNDSVLNEILNG